MKKFDLMSHHFMYPSWLPVKNSVPAFPIHLKSHITTFITTLNITLSLTIITNPLLMHDKQDANTWLYKLHLYGFAGSRSPRPVGCRLCRQTSKPRRERKRGFPVLFLEIWALEMFTFLNLTSVAATSQEIYLPVIIKNYQIRNISKRPSCFDLCLLVLMSKSCQNL